MERNHPRIQSLTSIRAFAALLVVASHGLHLSLPAAWWSKVILTTINLGFTGVDLFFILSGYILSYVYLNETDLKNFDRNSFWKSRFARVYPVYLFSFLLQVPFVVRYVIAMPDRLHQAIRAIVTLGVNLALLQAWDVVLRLRWNYPSWTLSVEAFFYFLFPFLGIWFWKKTEKRNYFLWILACFLTIVAPSTLFCALGFNGAFNDHNFPAMFVRFSPLMRLPEFGLGLLLMRFHQKLTADRKDTEWAANAFFWGGVGGALAGFTFLDSIRPLLLYCGMFDLCFAAIILGAALSKGFLASILSFGPLVLLGEASYGIYILQAPVGDWWIVILTAIFRDQKGMMGKTSFQPSSFFYYLTALILASLLTYWFIEKPLREKIRSIRFHFGPKVPNSVH